MAFIFDSYRYDPQQATATFQYSYSDGRAFTESVFFSDVSKDYSAEALDGALRLAFLVMGTSYVKTFPVRDVELPFAIDEWTAAFLNTVYQEGLSQYAFENGLTRDQLPHFRATGENAPAVSYEGEGTIALQSGGKDSLLTAKLLSAAGRTFTPWYIRSGEHHPAVLDSFAEPVTTALRTIDRDALTAAQRDGGLNGHVPVTFIVQSLAVAQAILLHKNQVLTSIGHEGEEPHTHIGDLPVTHQWSKTWPAEQLFSEYVTRYISSDITIGSPLRGHTELRIAELFVEHCWQTYGHSFSSCNRANYAQGADNTTLQWCGECPKCANSYLLFAPFVDSRELQSLFGGRDLFTQPLLQETFKGLMGVDGVMKPFECVGETSELRYAYHQAQNKHDSGYGAVGFVVPHADFDPLQQYPAQDQLRLL